MSLPPRSPIPNLAPPYQSFTSSWEGRARELVTQCRISVSTAVRAGGAPQLFDFTAIWGTGATNSVISPSVVAACNVQPIGITQVHTSNATCPAEQFIVDIYLPNKVVFTEVRVTNQKLTTTPILIGMDIIGMGDFAVTHKDGKTTFSYRWPSGERIDFVKQNPIILAAHGRPRNSRCLCGSGKKFKNCCAASQSA